MLQNHKIKLSIVLLLALATTVLSVWFINRLLFSHYELDKKESFKARDFLRIKVEEQVDLRSREQKPEPKPEPNRPAVDTLSFSTEAPQQMSLDIPKLDLSSALDGLSFDSGFAARNVTPMSGMPPNYPRRAQMLKIEGMVEIEFTITKDGLVEDIVVLNEVNGDHFRDPAIRALKNWRFKPRLINGKAVSQRAVQTFEFKLD